MDIRDASDAELHQLKRMIDGELSRRETLATAGRAMDDIARSVLAAQGQTDGGEWVQPIDATTAYPKGWTVQHSGKEWESLISANVFEPGVSSWREVAEAGSGPPEWVQPSGSTDAYNTGDLVTYNGSVYESVIDANVWSVEDYPAGWKLVS